MVQILADGIEINIENGQWRLFNVQGKYNTLTPFFTAIRGEGLVRYETNFGEPRGLPGDVLAVDYIHAVIVGLDQRTNRWRLGLQIALHPADKLKFAELVRWPAREDQQFAIDSHTAGRVLAEYLTCPLKLFGVTKSAQAGRPNIRATVTGPLVPHQRLDMDQFQVKQKANMITLPVTLGDHWLGSSGKNQLMLRLPKEATDPKSGGEAPAYNQVVIDSNAQMVRLVPQTSLLGAFFGPQGRAIKFDQIRNVELRRTITHESSLTPGEDGLLTDVTKTTNEYGVFLTMSDESLMLLKMTHLTTSDLTRRRIKIAQPGASQRGNAEENMILYNQHRKDQVLHDRKASFIENAAIVIAGALDRSLVKTTVGDIIE